jgi:hypothetical protein
MRLQVDLAAEVLEPEPRDVVAERRERTMKDPFSAMIGGRGAARSPFDGSLPIARLAGRGPE